MADSKPLVRCKGGPVGHCAGMRHRATLWRHHRWERVAIDPAHDRNAVAELRTAMINAFIAGSLSQYWQLERRLRQVLARKLEDDDHCNRLAQPDSPSPRL